MFQRLLVFLLAICGRAKVVISRTTEGEFLKGTIQADQACLVFYSRSHAKYLISEELVGVLPYVCRRALLCYLMERKDIPPQTEYQIVELSTGGFVVERICDHAIMVGPFSNKEAGRQLVQRALVDRQIHHCDVHAMDRLVYFFSFSAS